VFQNKPAYAWVLRNSLVRVVNILVCGRRSLDRYIVNVWDGDMGDLSLKDEGDVVVEDWYGVGPTHGEGH
jgi:hypothetical protein